MTKKRTSGHRLKEPLHKKAVLFSQLLLYDLGNIFTQNIEFKVNYRAFSDLVEVRDLVSERDNGNLE